MNDWRTIDESPASEAILLRGIPVTGPKAYERIRNRGGWFHLAAIAATLWRVTSWSASLLAHLVLMIVLVGILFAKKPPGEMLLEVSLYKGNRGEEGKALTPAKADAAPQAEPTRRPEREAERKTEASKEAAEEPPEEPAPADGEKKNEETARDDGRAEKNPDSIGKGEGSADRPKNSSDPSKMIEADPTRATRSARAGDLEKLRRGGDRQIVVVAGCYDHVERVLGALDVPHTRIERSQLGRYDLSQCLALLINCDSTYAQGMSWTGDPAKYREQSAQAAKRIEEAKAKLEKARKANDARAVRSLEAELNLLQRSKSTYDRMAEDLAGSAALPENVKKFVEKGGYLFTSDWGLTLLAKIYPSFVGVGGSYGGTVVKIAPTKRGAESPLLESVFVKPAKPRDTTTSRELKWDIDGGSYLISVKSDRVTTLVESSQIPGPRAVAVVFTPSEKGGRVLHVLSHFGKQQDRYGEFALQNLLLNFLLERVLKQGP